MTSLLESLAAVDFHGSVAVSVFGTNVFVSRSSTSFDGDVEEVLDHFADVIRSGDASVLLSSGSLLLTYGETIARFNCDPREAFHELRNDLREFDDDLASSILSFATIPFDPSRSGVDISIPAVAIRVSSTVVDITVTSKSPNGINAIFDHLRSADSSQFVEGHASGELIFPITRNEWINSAANAIKAIRESKFRKIVLSRRARMAIEGGRVDRLRSIERLAKLYTGATVFSVGKLLGATPELLMKRDGRFFSSHPLAGTTKSGGEAELLASHKDNHEHRIVVDHILESLADLSTNVEFAQTPSIMNFGEIVHLGTLIKGESISDDISSIDLLYRIHPTPAVAGVPTIEAVELIQRIEDEPRNLYAGAVGYQDGRGDGEWHLIIRTVFVDEEKNEVEFQAGVGLVDESDPEAEAAEIDSKLKSMLPIVTR
ncbi:MAG: chorismate-binding protein [Actinomycetota bacterium]|nr:chorismate-binding protein [Actinomycetota bacterium]